MTGNLQHGRCDIYAQDPPLVAHSFCQRLRGEARAASYIQRTLPRLRVQQGHDLSALCCDIGREINGFEAA